MDQATATIESPVTETAITPEVKAAIEEITQPTPVKVKKAAKTKKATVKTPKAKKTAKVEIPAPVVPVTPTPATPKAKIDTKAIVGNNFEVKIMGTCTKFIGSNKHAYIKGCTLELSDPTVKDLADRMDPISKEHAAKYHLGRSKAFVRKLADTNDLQSVLDIYFK